MKKNSAVFSWLLLAVLAAFSVARAWTAIISIDTARDLHVALQIVQGHALPLEGPVLASRFHLGPVWYYALALLWWLVQQPMALMVCLYALAASQLVAAYWLGRQLQGERLGLWLALMVSLPHWGRFEQVLPAHPMFVMPLSLWMLLCMVKYLRHTGHLHPVAGGSAISPEGGQGTSSGVWHELYLVLVFLCFGLAVHAHPTAVVMAFALLAVLARRLTPKRVLFYAALLALPFLTVLYQLGANPAASLAGLTAYSDDTRSGVDWSNFPLFWKQALFDGFDYWLQGYLMLDGPLRWFFLGGYGLLMVAGMALFVVRQRRWRKSLLAVLVLAMLVVFRIRAETTFYMLDAVFLLFVLVLSLGFASLPPRWFSHALVLLAGWVLCLQAVDWHVSRQRHPHGEFAMAYHPLIDIKQPHSPAQGYQFMRYADVQAVNDWLCRGQGKTIHGNLGLNVLHNYALGQQRQCPGLPVQVAGWRDDASHWVGLPQSLQTILVGRATAEQTAGMVLLPVRAYHGDFVQAQPQHMRYPPVQQAYTEASARTFTLSLRSGDYFVVTDYAFPFRAVQQVHVSAAGVERVHQDDAQSVFLCSSCEGDVEVVVTSRSHAVYGIAVF